MPHLRRPTKLPSPPNEAVGFGSTTFAPKDTNKAALNIHPMEAYEAGASSKEASKASNRPRRLSKPPSVPRRLLKSLFTLEEAADVNAPSEKAAGATISM